MNFPRGGGGLAQSLAGSSKAPEHPFPERRSHHRQSSDTRSSGSASLTPPVGCTWEQPAALTKQSGEADAIEMQLSTASAGTVRRGMGAWDGFSVPYQIESALVQVRRGQTSAM